MEPRFGTDFSGICVHTGSESQHLNRSLNAQAFTVGQDIYYGASKLPTDLSLTAHELTHVVQQTGGGTTQRKLARGEPDSVLQHGEYNPSSGAGQELLAHELMHVVQRDGEQLQRARTQAKEGAATRGAPSGREKGPLNFLSTPGWIQRAPDDKQPDWRHQLDEMLPIGSKKVAQTDQAEMLVGLYGEVGARELVTAVHANQAARAVVKQQGLSGLVALADTRNKQGLNVAAARQTLTQDPALFERTPLVARETRVAQQNRLADAGKLLQSVSDWASTEQTRQGVISIGAVVGLQSAQRDKLVEAIQRLTGVGKLAVPVAGELQLAENVLTAATAKAEEAKKLNQSHDPIDRLEALVRLGATATEATKARDALLKIIDRYDVSAVVQNIDRAATSSQEMENSGQSSGGAINAVINDLATAAKGVRTLRDNQAILPEAIERIVFLLRSFLAINAPGAFKPLTADEVKKIRSAFTKNISDDFGRVFRGGQRIYSSCSVHTPTR